MYIGASKEVLHLPCYHRRSGTGAPTTTAASPAS